MNVNIVLIHESALNGLLKMCLNKITTKIIISLQYIFLGNKYIHQLTAAGHTILRIELEDHSGNKRFAEYSSFTLADLNDNYRIHVSGYTGNAGTCICIS